MRLAGRVRWRTSRVAYVQAGRDRLIALHGPEVEPFPFSVSLAGGCRGRDLEPGAPVVVDDEVVWIGDRPYEASRPSRPEIVPAPERGRALHSSIVACRAVRRRRGAVAGVLEPVTEALRRGDDRAATELLVGWGPGLTPTGDDILVGLAAGDALCAGGRGARLIGRASRAAVGRTTFLSLALLGAARARRFAPALVALAEAGDEDDRRRAIARVERIGSTSGTDLLLGVEIGVALALAGPTPGAGWRRPRRS